MSRAAIPAQNSDADRPMSGSAAETRPPYRADIEGLRGVAVLLVVAYHAAVPRITAGYVGVDVFFVLSGYLITWLLLCEHDATGRIDLLRFYARRARRLLPAVGVMLAFTMLAAFVVYSPPEQRSIARSALATAAYVSNLWFAHDATNYFGTQVLDDPLLHTWSLAVEEQFYLAWPALMLAVFAWKRWRIAIIALVALASFALCVHLTRRAQPWAFFVSPTRAWEFCAGALALIVPQAKRWSWTGVPGIVAILLAATVFDRTTPYPGAAALLPVLGTVAVLRAPPRLLSNSVLLYVGQRSYSLYLWHWPVLIMAAAVVPTSAAVRSAAVALSFLLAETSYRWVERPIRRHPALVRRPRLALSMALAVTLVGIGSAMVWRHVASLEALSPAQARIAAAKTDTPGIDRCFVDFFGTDVIECTFGATDSADTVVLFGDSHVAQWLPALEPIAREHRWKLVTLLKAACPAADAPFVYPLLQRRYVECETWRGKAIARIRALRPRMVIESASQWYPMSGAVPAEVWQQGLRKTFQALQASGRIVHIADSPRPDFDVPDCLARAQWRRRWESLTCAFARDKALDAGVQAIERAAARDLDYVTYVDLNAEVCRGAQCPPQRDGMIVYQDSNHLTATFARSLRPALERALAGPG